MKKLLIVFTLLCPATAFRAGAQTKCTALGQTPAAAFPVCGSDTFTQNTVNLCGGNILYTPCSGDNAYTDINPYYYKFTCYSAGTLDFTITPYDLNDDYDWQLYDITGVDPVLIYSDPALYVVGNWSGTFGLTGASDTATGNIQCASAPQAGVPTFSKAPELLAGHTYLLLVSHFTNSQSGYTLSFKGGSASITDTTAPAFLQPGVASCNGKTITVLLNKKMQCSSVAADGSDFSLDDPSITITGASGNGCSKNFDMDTVTLTLSSGPPVGNYLIAARNGTDNNTLLDDCNTPIPAGATVAFAISPQPATPMDSLTKPGCAPSNLRLVFSKQILCSSIAPDGSDFIISGPSPVTVAGASGNCQAGGQSNVVLVQLSGPIVSGGAYRIGLVSGSDGNTIIDICGQETPAGATLDFILKDTVSAAFGDRIRYGCKQDTIQFSYIPRNGVDQWQWIFDGTDTTLSPDTARIYTVFNTKTAQLIVSNGFCSDTARKNILLGNSINAAFEAPNLLCPKDAATFRNNSTGNIVSWDWNFGDGTGSSFPMPPDHLFPPTGVETKYSVTLIVEDSLGCKDTAAQQVDVLRSCYIAVPSAFTPNGDGVNDYLYPLNAYDADDLDFRVYNRYGQLVFETREYTGKWDGRVGGQPMPAGTYVWTLQYTDRDTKKKYALKGTSILIR